MSLIIHLLFILYSQKCGSIDYLLSRYTKQSKM